MNGQESIIALRRRGGVPNAVWVVLLEPGYESAPRDGAEQAIANGFVPRIEVGHDEVPERLDFRCVIGMTVHLLGGDNARTIDVIDRLTEFDPLRIVACRSSPTAILDWTPDLGLVEMEIA